MQNTYILSIAGMDPSGGAGLPADLKTFEAMGIYGLAVCSAITYQTHKTFTGMEWVSEKSMQKQLEPLLSEYTIDAVKIGIIQNTEVLQNILNLLHNRLPNALIIWDPVLSASSGYPFLQDLDRKKLLDIGKHVHIITPNKKEMALLSVPHDLNETACLLSESCHVLITQYQKQNGLITDCLFEKGESTPMSDTEIIRGEKHGSGCVFSSALAASLLLENNLQNAVMKARAYIREYLGSGSSLLGYHYKGSACKWKIN